MDTLDIGAKIRNYRKEKGFSVQELAAKAGITASMLSQIERNLANPSINTLKVISRELNVPLYQFFTETESTDIIVRKDSRKILYNPMREGYELELLTPDTSGSIEFCLMSIPAGSNTGTTVSAHNGEEVAYVVRGPLTLSLNHETYILNTGDSVRIPPMTSHVWTNSAAEEGTIIFAVTPPCF